MARSTRPSGDAPVAPSAGKTMRGRPRTADRTPVGIQAVEIALDIVDHLARHDGSMSLIELSRATQLQPSKLHRYLVSLTRAALLSQSAASGQYDLGPMARRIGTAAFARYHGMRVVTEAAADICTATGFTVFLYVWTELGPTLVHTEMGRVPPAVVLREGTALPICGSATGRVFLAFLPRAMTKQLLDKERRLSPEEGFPSWSAAELEAAMKEIRADRIYRTTQAILPGPLLVAPVFDAAHGLHSVLVVIPERGKSTQAANGRLTAYLEEKLDALARML